VSAWRLMTGRRQTTPLRTNSLVIAAAADKRHANEEAVDEEKTGLMATASPQELPPYQDNDKKGSA
jgi:hypothetical protein